MTSGTESASGAGRRGGPAGTGRLVGELGLGTRRVIYGEPTPAELEAELTLMVKIDRAHLVMLAEQRLIPAAAVVALLRCIDELAADSFRPLLGRPMPRGLYLMYEGYLIERLGPEIGGVLHSGRSRNDLKATITSLRCRDRVLDLAISMPSVQYLCLPHADDYHLNR